MNLQIATAAEQQSTVAEEINRSVSAYATSPSSRPPPASRPPPPAASLARLGTQLQAQVGRFRL